MFLIRAAKLVIIFDLTKFSFQGRFCYFKNILYLCRRIKKKSS